MTVPNLGRHRTVTETLANGESLLVSIDVTTVVADEGGAAPPTYDLMKYNRPADYGDPDLAAAWMSHETVTETTDRLRDSQAIGGQ